MKRLYDWFRWNQGAQFAAGSILAIILIVVALFLLTGCAAEPLYEVRPINFNQWKSDDIQPCIVARDGVVWKMVDEVRNCLGWVPV